MNYKGMVFTDLDGTLLFRKKDEQGAYEPYIKDVDLESLKKLRESGYLIAIATGREVTGIRRFLRQSFIAFDFYVGSNGGIIFDQHFKVLKQKFIPKDVLTEVITFLKAEYPQMELMGTDGKEMFFFDHEYANAQVSSHKVEAKIISFEDYKNGEYEFIMMNAHPNETVKEDREKLIVELENIVFAKFRTRLNMFHNQDFLDFAPLNISKGWAVVQLAKEMNIPLEDVHVIGDSWNDLSMFETEAKSYSFAHAEEGIQAKVDHVVENFAEMVAKLHLIDE